MATTTAAAYSSAEENPKKTLDAASPSMDKSDPPSSSTLSDAEVSLKEGDGLKTTGTAVGLAAGESSGPADDIQKKIRRAERFGVPIQLSEKEKRNSRAERFGTAPSSKGSEESKQSEELKRKARAERFGIAAPTTATDEDAKKKARLARFAPYSKPDSVEEEKRKLRAIRRFLLLERLVDYVDGIVGDLHCFNLTKH
ncbi:protein MODIFIER OF SNC1 11-like [Gossypium australe]|uniref:Protein MODIFIER OF SNC1 11-like n=1 Tax=Gossypium australe TaxID=47621 RepID=A0A5B6UAH8_9ROSI|nr:protein MODIFIER OF SNC1 11-like [Gossypium australe]